MTPTHTPGSSSRRVRIALGVLMIFGLLAAACGGNDDASSDSAGSGDESGEAGQSDEGPIEIVTMWEVAGESDFGIDSMENAANLAIEEINEDGGVDGRMIESTRIPASIVDVQTLTSQFLEAEGMDPDLIVGFVAPTVGALTRQVNAAEIPVLGIGAYPIIDGLPVGSEWFFQLQANEADAAETYIDFAAGELDASSIAILHTEESFGTGSSDAGEAAVEAADELELVTKLGHSTTATDFTREVQEAKGADVIANYSFPNPLAAQIRAFDQAGIDAPTISGSSASTVASTGLVDPDQLERLYGVLNCNPSDESREISADFISSYVDEYGSEPDLIAMVAYDSMRLAAQAVADAGSTDNEAVAESLRSITFTDGACAPEWKADASQIFNHQQVAVSYDPETGKAVTEKVFELPAA